MRKKLSIKILGVSAPIFGMAFLLLISPCNVRNYIQSSLGVSKTEVNNKSKTTLSGSKCASFEAEISFSSEFNPSFKYLLLKNSFVLPKNLLFRHKKNTYSQYKRYIPNSKIPLYILFQNIKVYL